MVDESGLSTGRQRLRTPSAQAPGDRGALKVGTRRGHDTDWPSADPQNAGGQKAEAASLHQVCDQLYADYPLAVSGSEDGSGRESATHSMILMLRGGGQTQFHLLSRCDVSDEAHFYLIRPWRDSGSQEIRAGDHRVVTGVAVQALIYGVPLPRDGALFGWGDRDKITALVVFFAGYTPATPEPSWTVMPWAESPPAHWPFFVTERFFGEWFWDCFRRGEIISLDNVVAQTEKMVFWVDTDAELGWDSCAVMQDVDSGEGRVLPRGLYVYHQVLAEHVSLPDLDGLLDRVDKIDLSPKFRGTFEVN
jgi:hypothetical protein